MGDRAVRWMPALMVTFILGWVAARAARPISDPDDWWHLRLGNDLIAQRSLAAPDHWSVFATLPWVPTEPLPEVVAAYVERAAGLPGLAVLFAVACVAVVVCLYVTNRREAAPLPASLAMVLAALTASPSLTSRPQLVSFVLLPILLAAWLQTERDGRARWWLVPLVWLWSLCHGFWFVGVAYGGLFVVGFAVSRRFDRRTLLRLALLAAACGAVVALNPVGLGVLEAPFAVHGTSQFIVEWQRTQLTMPAAVCGILMITVTGAVWGMRRPTATLTRWLLLATAVFWLWYATRTLAIAGLVTAPLLANALEALVAGGTLPRREDTRRLGRRETALLLVAAAVAVLVVGVRAPTVARDPGKVPTRLDAALDALPPGTRVFNDYLLGGWLTWRHPDLNQYVDGLVTPYPPSHVQDYVTAVDRSAGWYAVIERSGARYALLRSDSVLASALEEHGWVSGGTDAGYVLLRRPAAG
jgi:hypothetical protein